MTDVQRNIVELFACQSELYYFHYHVPVPVFFLERFVEQFFLVYFIACLNDLCQGRRYCTWAQLHSEIVMPTLNKMTHGKFDLNAKTQISKLIG